MKPRWPKPGETLEMAGHPVGGPWPSSPDAPPSLPTSEFYAGILAAAKRTTDADLRAIEEIVRAESEGNRMVQVGSSIGEDARGRFMTEVASDSTEVMFVSDYTMTGAIWTCATCANWGKLVAVRNPAEARAHCESEHWRSERGT